jgi:hypothetical protein
MSFCLLISFPSIKKQKTNRSIRHCGGETGVPIVDFFLTDAAPAIGAADCLQKVSVIAGAAKQSGMTSRAARPHGLPRCSAPRL